MVTMHQNTIAFISSDAFSLFTCLHYFLIIYFKHNFSWNFTEILGGGTLGGTPILNKYICMGISNMASLETVSEISSDPPCNDAKTRFTMVLLNPWNFNLIKNMENTVVLFTQKVFISPSLLISKKCASNFRRETANKNKQFKETKTLIFKLYLIRQSFLLL